MRQLIYLDNASTAFPKPGEVLEYMTNFYAEYGVSPGRGGSAVAVRAGEMIENTRQKLTEFFGGTDSSRLVFHYNITDAFNLLINSVLAPGDHAICTRLEHNAVLRPLYFLSKYRGVEVTYVPFDDCGYVDPGDIESGIKDNTKLVVAIHGSNVLGTIQPVEEIGAICRKRGVLFAIDSAQTAGVIPINACDMNIDVVCFTGHKSLMGPTGIGGMYLCDHVEVTPSRSGGTGIKSEFREQPREYPWRMEFGTPNILGIAGLLAAQEWIASRGGVEQIHRREMELAGRFVQAISEITGVTLYCADLGRDHLPVISFNIDGLQAPDTGGKLSRDYNIACRAGLHCAPLLHETIGTDKLGGSVRISFGPMNTPQDVDAAIEAITEIAERRMVK